jgi:hypothetical protein
VSPYVRTVKTASGATAVQIVHSSHRVARDVEHIGSAHGDVQVEVLKASARQRLAAGQGELDLGLERTDPAGKGVGGGPLPITASRMGHLTDALEHGYRVPGLEDVVGGDEVFRQPVLARIIWPVSKRVRCQVLMLGDNEEAVVEDHGVERALSPGTVGQVGDRVRMCPVLGEDRVDFAGRHGDVEHDAGAPVRRRFWRQKLRLVGAEHYLRACQPYAGERIAAVARRLEDQLPAGLLERCRRQIRIGSGQYRGKHPPSMLRELTGSRLTCGGSGGRADAALVAASPRRDIAAWPSSLRRETYLALRKDPESQVYLAVQDVLAALLAERAALRSSLGVAQLLTSQVSHRRQPLPDDLHGALDLIHGPSAAH